MNDINKQLGGKIALITGASRGIGRAIAQRFAASGAKVVVHYNRNQTAAQETLDSLEGTGHIIVQGDIADSDAVQRMVETVVSDMGGIDILVNNAGVYEEHPIDEVSYDEWQRQWHDIMYANLIGAGNLAYCAAQHMIKQKSGRIINVSSRGAFRGEPESPAYGASKAGMNAMGQSLAKRLAPHNIGVMSVAPGWVDTDMAEEHLKGENGVAIRGQSPFNRVATPDEVAYAVWMLAHDDALFMSGTVVDVNGASHLRM